MKTVTHSIKSLVNKLPYIRTLYKQASNSAFPNGHFYSPVFSIDDIKKRQDSIWKNSTVEGVSGIDLKTNEQKELLKQFMSFYDDIPFKAEKQNNIRYQFDNGYFSYTDAITLYSMLRHYQPKKVIEIGSGHSSAVMLDTNQLFLNNATEFTFIDPYPERLYSVLNEEDKRKTTIIVEDVQAISLDVFQKLQAGDFLFIDSTHVSKTGSDVNYILFEILPVLKSGVFIHFHDIFYPFEYPKDWVFKGYNWNEDYILRAFLMYNDQFDIVFFPNYLHQQHKEVFKDMPLFYKNTGGSFWMVKK